jgi:hypothetical protein
MSFSIVIVIVSMIRVRPVWMSMGRCFVFVPMAVVGGVRRSREQMIVMAIVMPMPVLMHSSFMSMRMQVFFKEEKHQGDYNNQNGYDLSQRNRFSEKSCGQDDPKEGRTGEDDLTSSGTKFLG